MKTKESQEAERRDFDSLKSQMMTLQSRLGDQANREAEEEAKAAKKSFGRSARKNAMPPPDRSVYFDDFARKQHSPTRNQTATVSQVQPSQLSGLSRPTTSNMGGACEWDRLMREKEELLATGSYTIEDPLIKEIDRQI